MKPSNLWQCLVAAQDFPLIAQRHRADGISWWRSQDGTTYRGYASQAPGAAPWPWIELQGVVELPGASQGQVAPFHYVVETDVDPANLDEFNNWYLQEHLPGLAAVPGTLRAARYLRTVGRPAHVACYDLLSPQVLESEAWLAVRHTEWSSRVRPMFQNAFRTHYTRVSPDALKP